MNIQAFQFTLLATLASLVYGVPFQSLFNNNGNSDRYQNNVRVLQSANSLQQQNQFRPAWNILKSNYNPVLYRASSIPNPNSLVVHRVTALVTPYVPISATSPSRQGSRPAYLEQMQEYVPVDHSSNTPTAYNNAIPSTQVLPIASPPTTSNGRLQYQIASSTTTSKPLPTRSGNDANVKLQNCLESLQNFAQLQNLGLETLSRNRYRQQRLPFLGRIPNDAQIKICLQQINSN